MLNYVGGAIIFIKAFYADRIRLLAESWGIANDKSNNQNKFATVSAHELGKDKEKEATAVPSPTTFNFIFAWA